MVTSYAHKIQSEYYGGNQSESIEGITLDKFSATTHTETGGTLQARTCHAVFR